MIDLRFGASALVAVSVPYLIARRAARHDPAAAVMLDAGFGALVIGLTAARVTAVAVDDPGGLLDVRSLLSVRGGVELWAGVAAAVAYLAVRAVRKGQEPWVILACGAPLALWGSAAWEAGCALRDGCFGPPSPIGLVPRGLTTSELPVGIAIAAVTALVGLVAWRAKARAPLEVVVGSVMAFALVRSVASIWLPALGTGLTRPHRESIIVAGVSVAVLVPLVLRRARRPDEAVSGST